MTDICDYCQAVFGLKSANFKAINSLLADHPPPPTKNPDVDLQSTCEITKVEQVSLCDSAEEPLLKKVKLSPSDQCSDSLSSATPTLVSASSFDQSNSHCIICLGLCNESYIERLVDVILEKLDGEDYRGISSFVLAIHAPLSLKVRRVGMEHLLRTLCEIEVDNCDEYSDKKEVENDGSNVGDKLTESESCVSGDLMQEKNEPPTSEMTSTDQAPPLPVKAFPPTSQSEIKFVSDEYFVKTNIRMRVKYQIEKRRPQLTYNVNSSFLITIKLDHKTSDQDCIPLINMASDSIPKPKRKGRRFKYRGIDSPSVTTTSIGDALQVLEPKEFSENRFFLSAVQELCTYEIEFLHKPVFIGGRYNKYSRTLPQTPWVIDGVRKVDSSVEELICDKITDLMRADGHNFSSSGREDVDVRMLGNGRPFLIEFLNPRNLLSSQEELEHVQAEINKATSLIEVRQLKQVTKESTNILKKGEEEKQKCYSSLIWTPEEITPEAIKFLDEIDDLEIEQKTPIRVLHRRSLATRKRKVYSLEAKFVDSHHFSLLLTTQAGTYVKEFVHGDFGRTQPNLRVILKQDVDILSLDVLEVKVDWPI